MNSNGEWLMVNRRRAGLGLNRLATILGVDPSHISRVENDKRDPQREQLPHWAQAIGVDTDEIYYRFGYIPPDMAEALKTNPELRQDVRELVKG